ncbi:hypothetical protein ACJ41O_014278 [Fusarium nematophilum]
MSDSSGDSRRSLLPPWFINPTPSVNDQAFTNMLFGCTIGIGAWTACEAFTQTSRSWRRIRQVTTYVAFVWAEWWSCLIVSLIFWMNMRSYIPPSFEFYFFVIVLWSIQIQCLMQIIINRIALLMQVPAHATRLKWAIFFILLAIILSTFCVFIPARLQISATYIYAFKIWIYIKKGILLAVDIALNLYFIYQVRSHLIAAGLVKYKKLYRFNICMIIISISLDVLTIGLVSLQHYFIFSQIHPLTFLIKLHIEMRMADLIGKIVKASHPINSQDEPTSQSWSTRQSRKIAASLRRATRHEEMPGGDARRNGGMEDVEMGSQPLLCEPGTSKVGIPQLAVTTPRKGSGCPNCDYYGGLETLTTSMSSY